jgi:hypothetical protein
MKKRISAFLITVTVSIIATQTIDAAYYTPQNVRRAQVRRGTPQRRGQPVRRTPANRAQMARAMQARRAMQAKRITPTRRGATITAPQAPTQAPTTTTTINQKQKNLEAANAQFKKAKNPAEKALARKKVIASAQEILRAVTEERTVGQDILTGYTPDQKEAAKYIITELEPQKMMLETLIAKKQQKVDAMMDKGWIWNSVKAGKENQYEKETAKLNALKKVLKDIEQNIHNQKIIAGQKLSKTFMLAIGSISAVAIGTGAYLYFGPAVLKQGYENFRQDPKKFAYDTWEALKSKLPSWARTSAATSVAAPQITANDNAISIDGRVMTREELQARFGQNTSNSVVETVKSIATQMAVSTVISKTLSLALSQLDKLLQDPDATPEEVEAQTKKVKNLNQQEAAKSKAPARKPQK